jgi:hypothetical protein
VFLCKSCLDEKEGGGHFDKHMKTGTEEPADVSYGPCESCGETSECVDCKCYKERM